MSVEEKTERDSIATEHDEVKQGHGPSDARRAAAVEAAYILEALRK